MKFNLPIESEILSSKKQIKYLNDNVIDDLELKTLFDKLHNIDISNVSLKDRIINQYSNNPSFLQAYSEFISNQSNTNDNKAASFISKWNSFKNDVEEDDGENDDPTLKKSFKQNNFFIDWSVLDFMNRNSLFHLFSGLQTLLSPLLTIIVPIIMLLIPFVLVKYIWKQDLTLASYRETCAGLFKNHAFGIFFQNWNNLSASSKIMGCFTVAFFMYSFYQNVQQATKYYKLQNKICSLLNQLRSYLINTRENINDECEFITETSKNNDNMREYFTEYLKNHTKCIERIDFILETLEDKCISENNETFNITNILSLGTYMTRYYDLQYSSVIEETMNYNMDYHYYKNYINSLKNMVIKRDLNIPQTLQDNKNTKKTINVKELYYPFLLSLKRESEDINNIIKNNYTPSRHVLTGPNGSGKTTYIKSVAISLIYTLHFCKFKEMRC